MNERIKNFYDQVGLDFENFQRVTVTKGDMEKFAELLVGECMDIAWRHTPDTEECEYSWLIYNKIKQHFGVEE
jgi:hypothetical protein